MKFNHLALAFAAIAATSVNAMATEHLKSVNPAYIDNSVPAGDDFYHHVNNGWLKAHPLTAEYARYGVFNILNDSAENQVKEIVLNLGATNPEPGTNAFKSGPSTRRAWTPCAATPRVPLPSRPISANREHYARRDGRPAAVDAQILFKPLLRSRSHGGYGRL